MNKALRKAIIAGNWKMNKNRKEAAELIEALKPIAADKTCWRDYLRTVHQPGNCSAVDRRHEH